MLNPNTTNIPKFDIVIYHSPCIDGTAGAYVAKIFNESHPCEFFGTKPGLQEYDFPDVTDKNVLIVDISFSRAQMLELKSKSKYLLCIDHHKTAKENLKGLDFCYFDMTKSGVQLAWDILTPYSNCKRPEFIDYIGGRDLWDFSNPQTDIFSTGLFQMTIGKSMHEVFEIFDRLMIKENKRFVDGVWQEETVHSTFDLSVGEKLYQEIISYGKIYNEFKEKIIDSACKSAVKCNMSDTYTVWAVDSWRALDRSKVGNILAQREDCDFSVCYTYDIKEDAWWISLRSIKGKFDVSNVASQYSNGGGHECAAGFTWKGSLRNLLRPVNTN